MDPNKIKSWIDDVQVWSEIVFKLRNPNKHFSEIDSCVSNLVRINAIGAVAIYPLLMVGYKKYWLECNRKSFNKLIEVCLKYSLRTKTIANANVGKYTHHLFKTAREFYNAGHILNIRQLIIKLKTDDNLYPSDEKLCTLLDDYQPTITIASILLELIEESYGQKKFHNTVTVDYIMPKLLNDEWTAYICNHNFNSGIDEAKGLHKMYHKRLGNLTLLDRDENSKEKNKLFEIKKEKLYRNSDYETTRMLVNFEDWRYDEIIKRQDDLVKKTVEITKL